MNGYFLKINLLVQDVPMQNYPALTAKISNFVLRIIFREKEFGYIK